MLMHGPGLKRVLGLVCVQMDAAHVAVRTTELAGEIAAYLERPGSTLVSLSSLSGVNVRTLRGIIAGRYRTTSIWTADKIMTALGTHYLYLEIVPDTRYGDPSRRSSCIPAADKAEKSKSGRPRRLSACVPEKKTASPAKLRTQLKDLVLCGLLEPGTLIYASRAARDGGTEQSFEAVITADGEIEIRDDGADGALNGRAFPTSSAAITALYGRPDGGWKNWWLDFQGRRVKLEYLRQLYESSQQPQSAAA